MKHEENVQNINGRLGSINKDLFNNLPSKWFWNGIGFRYGSHLHLRVPYGKIQIWGPATPLFSISSSFQQHNDEYESIWGHSFVSLLQVRFFNLARACKDEFSWVSLTRTRIQITSALSIATPIDASPSCASIATTECVPCAITHSRTVSQSHAPQLATSTRYVTELEIKQKNRAYT